VCTPEVLYFSIAKTGHRKKDHTMSHEEIINQLSLPEFVNHISFYFAAGKKVLLPIHGWG